jgi:NADPH2:quinone reductase
VEVVTAIGADRVIDYTKEDFTSDRERYFSAFDAVGKESFAHCRGVIEPGGTYLPTDGFRNLLLGFWTSRFGDRKVKFKLPPRYTQQDVVLIKELMEAGSYQVCGGDNVQVMHPPRREMHTKHPRRLQRGHPNPDWR